MHQIVLILALALPLVSAVFCGSVQADNSHTSLSDHQLPAISNIKSPPRISSINDPAYHNLEKLNNRLFFLYDSISAVNPNWIRIDSIGHSQAEHLPIYCIKISTNVNDTTSDRPAVILCGQVHAEEVLGVEYLVRMIPTIVGTRRWRQSIDTYIIPTLNPEGLRVVYSLDYTYRKNKRDNIGDGLFRYKVGWGQDTSGVDINRNFPLYWQHGTGLLVRGDNEFYDYYRGPGPASEPETQAFIRLAEQVRPLYSLIIHSSRTGNVAEKVIYPWSFAPNDQFDKKTCPDIQILDELASAIALRCKRYGQQDKTYEPVRIVGAKGDSELYMYWKHGTFAMRMEIGAMGEAMQPDSVGPDSGMYQVFNGVKLGMEYFLNSAAGITRDSQGDVIRSRLDIKVISQTGQPLAAKLMIPALSKPIMPYKTTNPRNGMYYWMIPASFSGSQRTITASAFGYRTKIQNFQVSSDPARITIRLDELPRYRTTINLTSNNLPLDGPAEVFINHPDSSWNFISLADRFDLTLPEGEYEFTFASGDKVVPRRSTVNITSDTTLHVALSPAIVLLNQSFDSGDVTYTSDYDMNTGGLDSLARWELINDVYRTPPRSFTDSRLGNTIKNEDGWGAPYNMFAQHFDLSACSTAALIYYLNQALEPGYDSMWVEISTGGSSRNPANWTWTQIAPAHQELSVLESVPLRPWNAPSIRLQRYGKWQQFIIPLDSLCGQPVIHFRFHLRSDNYQEEDGVYIDDVLLLASGNRPPEISSTPLIPERFTLSLPYPNPFNGRTTLRMTVPQDGIVEMGLFDINGRLALNLPSRNFPSGVHRLAIDAQSLPAGIYLLKASANGASITRKLALVK